jgi:hypothetical protein
VFFISIFPFLNPSGFRRTGSLLSTEQVTESTRQLFVVFQRQYPILGISSRAFRPERGVNVRLFAAFSDGLPG